MSAAARQAVALGSPPEQLHWPFRERRWVGVALAITDLVALQTSFLLGYLLRSALLTSYPAGLGPSQLRGIAVGLLLLPIAHFFAGLYPGYGLHSTERLRLRMKTSITVFVTLIIWDYLIQHGDWSRGVLVAAASFALVLPAAAESILIQWLRFKGYWGTPVLVLGSGNTNGGIAEKLRQQGHLGLVPALNLDESELSLWITDRPRTIRVAVVAIPTWGHDRLAALVEKLPFPRVIVFPETSGFQSALVTPVDLDGILGLELKRNLLLRSNRLLKRLLDLVLGLPLFVVSVPLIALFALWIKKVSPGPAFYVQERGGRDGKTIRVWKLRTMYPDADRQLPDSLDLDPQQREEWSRCFKVRDDPRILPGVGTFLRRSSLDELPQFWSVLVGEMSLVGPRPFPFYHLEQFPLEFRRLRSQAWPGITGLWQVSDRSNGDLGMQESLDTYYIRNWSIWLDVHILASTLRAVWKGQGAY